jgi:dynein heavy chain
MDKTMEKPEEELKDMIKANLSLPPKIPPKETPYFGMVPIPQHDFPEQFSNFCFNSLYIKEEVIRCMVEIRDDCNNLLKDNRIFDVSVKNKTLRVEEFKQLQSSSIATIKFNTRESGWVGRLEKIIKTSFNDVGKGWFNIHETSKETYEFGKLKKFLTLVNFMMQDTVLTLCKDSVKEFVAYVLAFCPTSTTIESTSKVQNQFPEREIEEEDEEIDPYQEDDYTQTPDDQLDRFQIEKKFLQIRFAKNRDPDPLFILDLNLKKGQIIPQYSTDPADIVSKIMEVFDEGIKCLQAIPQLEPILLKHLFKTHKKTLKAPTIPLEKPALPDPAKKHILPDENTWLWEASN